MTTPDRPKLGECRNQAKCRSKWRLDLSDAVASYRCGRMVTVLRPYPTCIQARTLLSKPSSPNFFSYVREKNVPGDFLHGAENLWCRIFYSDFLNSRSKSRFLIVSLLSKIFLPLARAIWSLTRVPLPYNETGMMVKPFISCARERS